MIKKIFLILIFCSVLLSCGKKGDPKYKEPKDNAKNAEDKRPPASSSGADSCGSLPAAYSRSRQMRTLKMWAGDSFSPGDSSSCFLYL